MARKATNTAASVRARLQNLAREKQTGFQLLLTRYALERLLYRLGESPHRDSFILKGAMLYAAWLDDPFRPTRDIDLLSRRDIGAGDGEPGRLAAIFREIFEQAVEEDGMVFDSGQIAAEPIREGQPFAGVRVRTSAQLGKAAIPVQIDIGFGDVVTPGPTEIEYPVLLPQPAPRLRAYPRETVAAEKFVAMVTLDLANSRMKDFYDLLAMSRLFTFEGAVLAKAIGATFERRGIPVPSEPPTPFTAVFSENPQKVGQWRSFLARETLYFEEPDLPTVVREIGNFIMPAARGAVDGNQTPGRWHPDSGWNKAANQAAPWRTAELRGKV